MSKQSNDFITTALCATGFFSLVVAATVLDVMGREADGLWFLIVIIVIWFLWCRD